MHIICNLTDVVDYRTSKFFTYYNYAHNLGYIDISSRSDFEQKKIKIKKDNPGKIITIWAEKIALNNMFNKSLDLFQTGEFDSNYYISEKLNEAIIEAKITGINVQLTNKLFFC